MKAYGIPYAVGTLEGIGLIAVLRTPFVCLIVVALMLTACVRPVIVGTQGGHCDRGFTAVAASDELRRMTIYSPDVQYRVEELIQQAGQNLDATLRCSKETGEQTVTYTFQVWTLEDLKNWRSLAPTPPPLPTPSPEPNTEEGTAGNSDARSEKQRESNPTIVGNPGGECDYGPTSISAEPEVNLVAHPGTSLHYGPVSYLNFAAELNGYDTEDCSRSTGESPVYYTLHIRSVDELKAYGALAQKSDRLKLDLIKATEIVKAGPTPTPRPCFYEMAYLYAITDPHHPDYEASLERGESWVMWSSEPSSCLPNEPTGSIRTQSVSVFDGWVAGAEIPCPTHASRGSRCALASPPPTPTSRPLPTSTPAPRTCFTERATLRGPEGALYFEWVPKARPCGSHEPAGSVKKQDVPGEKEVFELFGTPRPWER